MSNVPHHYTTPEEDYQNSIIGTVIWAAFVILCVLCLITEGFDYWPIYIPTFGCVGLLKINIDGIKESKEKINKSKGK